ncbi:cell wall-binding repeat-containing protein [Euzebya tangerina]|uniref:cell wall-binding repeat-containing protein n=1 Tax=Euzebya tangerina TaxID=591198 RepID=UPI000E31330A|nr:cell wall-binding repeat-containing protein [Euzebya tangerina]
MIFPARELSVRLALCLALALLAGLIATAPAAAVEDVTTNRLEGPERTATAAEIARAAFPDGTTRAVLATSVEAPDALTASALAGATDAAMLLLQPDRVPGPTADALRDLGVVSVTIVGGPISINEDVATELAEDYDVRRIFGEDQYETAAAVATEALTESNLPVIDGQRTVILASGENFPDALAGSAAAVAGPVPVLYAETDTLTDSTRDFLDAQPVEQVVILGGPVAVAQSVQDELEDRELSVVRLGGGDRVETAAIVAEWTSENFSFQQETVLLARGDDFPDALTAGQLAGRFGRPLVLSATPRILPPVAEQYFADGCETIEVVTAIGGINAVADDILSVAEVAAEQCRIGGGTPVDGQYVATPAELQTETLVVDSIVFSQLGSTTSFDAIMLPCASVTTSSTGTTLALDDEGEVRGYGSTQTSSSLITGINGADVDNVAFTQGVEPEDGELSVEVSAFDDDCAVVMLIPAQDSETIPVDDEGAPTTDFGVSFVTFGSPPDPGRGPDQVYTMEPTEPRVVAPGTATEVVVTGRFDGEDITADLDLVFFPCESSSVLTSDVDRFDDDDRDRGADGFGESDTGNVMATAVNGQAIDPDTVVGNLQLDAEGQIRITLESDAADCATITVIDGNGNGKFDITADGVPIEEYGVTQVRFET